LRVFLVVVPVPPAAPASAGAADSVSSEGTTLVSGAFAGAAVFGAEVAAVALVVAGDDPAAGDSLSAKAIEPDATVSRIAATIVSAFASALRAGVARVSPIFLVPPPCSPGLLELNVKNL
jgi:hypothetical protein